MNIKKILVWVMGLSGVSAGISLAATPTITIVFTDPQGLCKDQQGQTLFSFNYAYEAEGGVEYYSGPTPVNHSLDKITVPPPSGPAHYYSSFEITDQNNCGAMDLDYEHPGNCYLTNLIPDDDREKPYSYRITLTPKPTGNHTYGNDMYNLSCQVDSF